MRNSVRGKWTSEEQKKNNCTAFLDLLSHIRTQIHIHIYIHTHTYIHAHIHTSISIYIYIIHIYESIYVVYVYYTLPYSHDCHIVIYIDIHFSIQRMHGSCHSSFLRGTFYPRCWKALNTSLSFNREKHEPSVISLRRIYLIAIGLSSSIRREILR